MDRRSILRAALTSPMALGPTASWGILGQQPSGPTLSVRDFGARGDGATDDAAAFQRALEAANEGPKVVRIPPGEYVLGSTVTVAGNGVTLAGYGHRASRLRFQGRNGPAIHVTSAEGVRLEGFQLRNNAGGEEGVYYDYVHDGTSFQHVVQNVRINGFGGAGFRAGNLEQFLGVLIRVNGCGVGFDLNNESHEGDHHGINNLFVNCRAQACGSQGWMVNNITTSHFIQCQGLHCGGPQQFLVRGDTQSLVLSGLDVEMRGGHAPGDTGLQLSGIGHIVMFNAWNMKTGVLLRGARRCVVFPWVFSNVATPVRLESGARDNVVMGPSSAVDDPEAGATLLGPPGRAVLHGWVSAVQPTVALGPVPDHAVITSVSVEVVEPFPGSASLSAALSGAAERTGVAVGLNSVGRKEMTGSVTGYAEGAPTVQATLEGHGAGGRALVLLEYVRVAAPPG